MMMTFPRLLVLATIGLSIGIGVAYFKKQQAGEGVVLTGTETVAFNIDVADGRVSLATDESEPGLEQDSLVVDEGARIPDVDVIDQLFDVSEPKAPFVKTVTYKSRVPWLQGRPAWVADYATHFRTSRHFIARSLNRGPDYFTQNVSNGDRFNVIDEDKDVRFHLVVDTTLCRCWFYAYDADKDERYLLKTYPVGLGRPDPKKPSGTLTPLGRYELGEKIAIYKPKGMGWFNGEKVEMVRVFGTRWIPFEKELGRCSAPAKGFGLHGAPWAEAEATGDWQEVRDCIGRYESDGCVRFLTEDIEELFSIIITRPTVIDLVKDFREVELPGHEVFL